MAFNMFRGLFTLDGSQSPADLFLQAIDQLLQLNIQITRKEDQPSYLNFLTNHLNSNSNSTLTTPSKQPPLVDVVTPIITEDTNSPLSFPPMDSPLVDNISPPNSSTRPPMKSLRSFRHVSMGVYGVWSDV